MATEKQAVAFNVLTGSAEKSAKLMGELNKFALKTPFNIEEVREYAKRLVSANIPQEKIIETMGMLGDMASGTGADLGLLAKAYIDVKSKGMLFAQELTQLGEKGINVREILANDLKISVEELSQELNQKGGIKVSFQQLDKVMRQLHTEKFKGMMNTIAEGTASGRLQNFQESLNLIGQEILGIDTTSGQVKLDSIFDLFSKSLQKSLIWIEENKDAIMEFGKKATKSLIDITKYSKNVIKLLFTGDFEAGMFGGVGEDDKLVENLLKVRDVAKEVVEGVKKITDWASDNKDLLINIGVVFGGIATGIWLAVGAVNAFNVAVGIFAFLTSPIGLVGIAIGLLIAGIILLIANWDTVKLKFDEGVKFIIDLFVKLGIWIWDTMNGFGEALLSGWKSIEKFGTDIQNAFNRIATGIGDSFKGTFNSFSTWAKNGINSMIDELNKGVSSLNSFGNAIEKVSGGKINVADIGNIPKLAKGGDFIVPQGYPNDSYLMGVQSGERVIVQTPQQQNDNRRINNQNITYNNYGSYQSSNFIC
jgi:hypothetical protein